jgi:uncharacterized protein YgiM (DUF1202 family)
MFHKEIRLCRNNFSLSSSKSSSSLVFLSLCSGCHSEVTQSTPATNIPANIENPTSTPIPEIVVGVVVVDILNVREGPGTSYPILSSLAKGDKFYILGDVTNNTNNKWLLIEPSEGSFGWVIGDQSYVNVQQNR